MIVYLDPRTLSTAAEACLPCTFSQKEASQTKRMTPRSADVEPCKGYHADQAIQGRVAPDVGPLSEAYAKRSCLTAATSNEHEIQEQMSEMHRYC